LGLAEGSGQVASLVAANTALSGACGGLSAFLAHSAYFWFVKGEILLDLVSAMNGVLSGLVAVTAGCATMDLWASLVTGTIAGWLYLIGSYGLVRFRIDDVVDSIPVHLVNGMWGMLACGIFSSNEHLRFAFGIEDSSGLLVNQIIGMFSIVTWSTSMAVPFFLALNYFGILRSNMVAEVIGLDVVDLDESKRGDAISGEVQQDIDIFRHELDTSRKGASKHNIDAEYF
jgi:ammonium transporter, Amt family